MSHTSAHVQMTGTKKMIVKRGGEGERPSSSLVSSYRLLLDMVPWLKQKMESSTFFLSPQVAQF